MQNPNGILRVIGNDDLNAAEQAANDAASKERQDQELSDQQVNGLVSLITTEFQMMRNHRNNTTAGWSDRLLAAMRAFNGQYDPGKLGQIREFGGSDVYARLVAMKCRGASSLLRDVYLGPDRPWGIEPPDDPTIPENVLSAVSQLVQSEISGLIQDGQQVSDDMVSGRTFDLMQAARNAAKKHAVDQAQISEEKIDEILKEGNFYKAFSEFMTDLPLFPYACIKGPVVRVVPTVTWKKNKAKVINQPRLFWERVSPFDIWWTPGVSDIEDAAIVERTYLTRADLNDLLDLPGYNQEAVRNALIDYGNGGLVDNWDQTDAERADMESRENPMYNRSGLISCLLYTGNVQGLTLLSSGAMTTKQVTDPVRDYSIQAWMVGRYIIKAQINPSPRKRHNYYITSFEKVPGTPVGNGLPDILSDVQDVANATLRSLVNNMAIASGPQVVVNDDLVSPGTNSDELYPWKRWHTVSNQFNQSSALKPVDFFQPNSNAQELLSIYQAFANMADEISAIPKYLTGSGAPGGAGRTASGLAMLMGNASKLLQTVAANVDRDILDPALGELYDMVMMTDKSGLLTGEEKVRVLGVAVATQKETLRARQQEFLQTTANPIDLQIIGPAGRAKVLRAVANTIGLDGEDIVPSDQQLQQQQKQAAQAAAQQGVPGHAGINQPPPGSNSDPNQQPQDGIATNDQGPRTNISGGVQ